MGNHEGPWNIEALYEKKPHLARAKLGSLTQNCVMKAGLASLYEEVAEIMGFISKEKKVKKVIEGKKKKKEEQRPDFMEAIYEDMGLIGKKPDYPFYEPVPIDQLRATSSTNPTLGDVIREVTEEKYRMAGSLLVFNAQKTGSVLNAEHPNYYMGFVSTCLDLICFLTEVCESFGNKFEIPTVPKGTELSEGEHLEYLVEESQAHDFYQRLRGAREVGETAIERRLKAEVIDAAVAVFPNVSGYGTGIIVLRRKSPQSIADKLAYGMLSLTINTAYDLFYPRRKKPETRMKKYDSNRAVRVGDILGMSLITCTHLPAIEDLPAVITESGFGSLVRLRDPQLKERTGELHFDLNLSEDYLTGRDELKYLGRTEFHAFSDVKHFVMAQISGPDAWLPFKARRIRELAEAQPSGRRAKRIVEYAHKIIYDAALDVFMPSIRLAEYPGRYYIINRNNLTVPIKSLELATDTSPLEGRYSLYNMF